MAGPGHSFLGQEEARLVREVLSSWQLSRYRFDADEPGEPSMVYRFEREMEKRLGVRHCLAVNSGTSALLTAFAAAGIGPGDEVLVPGYTFIASIAAVVYSGAVPVLVEIDDSLTLDPDDVAGRVTDRTRAILAVHMLGGACDLRRLRSIADRNGLLLIEDVAQAAGGSYLGQRLGTIGELGAFSLNTFKVITSGEGGWLACQDDELYERAFAFHDHGFRPFRAGVQEGDSLFGLNLRMNDLVGAVALAQGRKLDDVLRAVREQRDRLLSALDGLEGARLRRSNDPDGDCGTVVVLILKDEAGARRLSELLGTRTLIDTGRHYYGSMPQLASLRLPSPHACPFHCPSRPWAQDYRRGALPETDGLLGRSIALSVGVVDTYLGPGYGLNVRSRPEEAADVAEHVRRALASLTP